MFCFEREKGWPPTPGINTNSNRNNIFLTRVPKIIDLMFLLQNLYLPAGRPFTWLPRVTAM